MTSSITTRSRRNHSAHVNLSPRCCTYPLSIAVALKRSNLRDSAVGVASSFGHHRICSPKYDEHSRSGIRCLEHDTAIGSTHSNRKGAGPTSLAQRGQARKPLFETQGLQVALRLRAPIQPRQFPRMTFSARTYPVKVRYSAFSSGVAKPFSDISFTLSKGNRAYLATSFRKTRSRVRSIPV